MPEKVTISDVARIAGVSKRTVSRVINNSPMVGAASREKVKQIIDDLGYQPNPQARGLASSRSYLIGLIYDNPDPFFIDAVIRAVSEVCRQNGFELVVHPSRLDDPQLIDQSVNFVSRAKIDGVIIPPPISEIDDVAEALDLVGVPSVRLAARWLDGPTRVVVSDERQGARKITEYMVSCGHRKIGYIAGPKGLISTRERRAGHREALRNQRVSGDPDAWEVRGEYTFQSGIVAARDLLSRADRPTAIFASNDQMANGVLHVAQEMGLSVPADLSVAGFDDSELASQTIPALTTVRRPVRQMAIKATLKLIARIEGRDEDADLECVLAPQLVVRDSTDSIK